MGGWRRVARTPRRRRENGAQPPGLLRRSLNRSTSPPLSLSLSSLLYAPFLPAVVAHSHPCLIAPLTRGCTHVHITLVDSHVLLGSGRATRLNNSNESHGAHLEEESFALYPKVEGTLARKTPLPASSSNPSSPTGGGVRISAGFDHSRV